MTATQSVERENDSRRQSSSLDTRYREIGISAVAAAVRFKCEVRNPAYAPDMKATENAYGFVAEA